MSSDLEIARAAKLRPIATVADEAKIPAEALHSYGLHVAKIDTSLLPKKDRPAKLVLVTAINPTPAGEGKTTTTIGLGDALRRLGKACVIALREPSLGPCFGTKGGATGGGYAQIVPMERINLHLTGDFHAITSAHNLLAALIDNHLYWGAEPKIDSRKVAWRRVLDMNDRALRQIVVGLGGGGNGYPRETGFDITAASEIMAIFCLSKDLADLQQRLAQIIVAQDVNKQPVRADALQAVGAMTVLLKDALMPNLVQTLEGTPTFVHGGPFANIAHGCNSVAATLAAMQLGDYVVTEAGFGADLGAEKFLDIKCRQAGIAPSAAVIVATARALKSHGGVAPADLNKENLDALKAGLANLGRHIANVKKFGLPVVVAINHFLSDTEAEQELIAHTCRDEYGVEAIDCRHWAAGGKGALALAEKVIALVEGGTAQFKMLYEDTLPLIEKMRRIAQEIYGAADISLDAKAKKQLADIEAQGFGHFPVCVAKTQYSFAADPKLLGAPTGHIVPIREVRLSAGAGFVVMICGDIMTMPGLSRQPAAWKIGLDAQGNIEGLF
ncbi:formate--tetrahydrofolate ligase [Beijerinckia indica]|uniref:Formate--tetrahydrofolate ligase n=1 Tax=Beijerinckia indica subsp. indica (strain ATCC 9039 / DSM 1715 / NCIMB 8712) TaxID=395963 RepID=FTHS_BEII9|nr:formate--tetrahydrofolate ligase [Beijerinckia indica]B2IC30.1 RecName: Full=Formate--tetrahydrofolate ligase; AltName: Full=Formyltetrahydrofolate synthetase; Short=FHS; Short=FTHFS [Beijerinckia indica subsp. indica ATCC 9039]ACB95285.1 Formate--tetrahydrofolate ligase [Beijerinckia indica subsp. indica ATCC 9039]